MMDSKAYFKKYHSKLKLDVIPFWTQHSIDQEDGGYYTCLLEDGRIYDTDKFIWLQARQVWTFAKLYNQYKDDAYLATALHGAKFLQKHGRDSNGHWYFALDKTGNPLVQAYNIFSDCFACMAFGQLYNATGDQSYAKISKLTFEQILNRRSNPKGQYNKQITTHRALRNFALPMILCNLVLEIESLLDNALVNQLIDECVDMVLQDFYQDDLKIVIENINADGSRSDTMDGRLVNPGHAIEAMWFLMDIGVRQDNKELIIKAKDIMLKMIAYGWDEKHGGIFYFLDHKGYPPQQLEWDQKLWWVHLEALIATIKAYQLTGDKECLNWFAKIDAYTWQHFDDPKNGEWFGYLKRDGTKLNQLKGGKWKGCFHVPRGLLYIANILENIQS